MQTVSLKRKLIDGSVIEATFAPDNGMNLMSLKRDKIELIDQSTKDLFIERSAGLGALIGPHFYHLKEEFLPKPCPDTLFPHIPKMIAKGQKDYFSHGIGRYVPWKYTVDENKISAMLSSVDIYQNHSLFELEGSNFFMSFEAEILEDRFRIRIGTNSDRFSLIGLHYYFSLKEPSTLCAKVEPHLYENGIKKEIPSSWLKGKSDLYLDLNHEYDHGFIPIFQEGRGLIEYITPEYTLQLIISPQDNSECSFQVYHPLNSSFVCIEPISAINPRGNLPKGGALLIDFILTA